MRRAGNRNLQEVKGEGEGVGGGGGGWGWGVSGFRGKGEGGVSGSRGVKGWIKRELIIHVTHYLPNVHMSTDEDRLVVDMRTNMRVVRQEDKLLSLQDAVSDAWRWLMFS